MIRYNWENLGSYELMQILHELHKLGYQKLRWISYVSPNGMYLRCHITTQDHILENKEVHFDYDQNGNKEIWYTSVGKMTTGIDITPLLKTFMDENPRLLEIGKGEDPEYVEWFNNLLILASKGNMPVFYEDYWTLPVGRIYAGKTIMKSPPTRMRIISWNIDGIKAHFDALKKLVKEYSPDIICLQKVKDIKDSPEFEIEGYRRVCNSASYSGVATYVKNYVPCVFDQMEDSGLTGYILKTEIFSAYRSFRVLKSL